MRNVCDVGLARDQPVDLAFIRVEADHVVSDVRSRMASGNRTYPWPTTTSLSSEPGRCLAVVDEVPDWMQMPVGREVVESVLADVPPVFADGHPV
jgi:hypothetical protein